MLSINIITAPRNPCYLSLSLDSYFRHWDIKPNIIAEPRVKYFRYRRYCNVLAHDEHLGIVHNWLKAAEIGLLSNEPFIMICEDDIEWRDQSSYKIRSLLLDELNDTVFGFISPYCSTRNSREYVRDDWHEARLNNPWCGALCTIFRRSSLELLLKYRTEFIKLTEYEGRHINLDTALGEFYKRRDFPILTHTPTLILHLGEVSTNENVNANETIQKYRQPAL